MPETGLAGFQGVIKHWPQNERTRMPEAIERNRVVSMEKMTEQFMKHGYGSHKVPVYRKLDQGLAASGWAEIPDGGIRLGEGAFGEVKLAYNVTESGIKLENRHLAVIKIQPRDKWRRLQPHDMQRIWKEVDILRGLVHENIIDYYDHFVVYIDKRLHIFILMEYANAGDLGKEMERFDGKEIKESGARYHTFMIFASRMRIYRCVMSFSNTIQMDLRHACCVTLASASYMIQRR